MLETSKKKKQTEHGIKNNNRKSFGWTIAGTKRGE
jgi:hypothetical protein